MILLSRSSLIPLIPTFPCSYSFVPSHAQYSSTSTSKVRQRDRAHDIVFISAEFLDQNASGIGSSHAVHGVEQHLAIQTMGEVSKVTEKNEQDREGEMAFNFFCIIEEEEKKEKEEDKQ